MSKIKSREDLAALRDQYRGSVIMRLVSDNPKDRTEINVGMADCGIKAGARDILKALFNEANTAGIEKASVMAVDCFGDCDNEPIVEVKHPGKDPVRYTKVDMAKVKEIIAQVKEDLK